MKTKLMMIGVALLFVLATSASASGTDYMQEMITACTVNDVDAGVSAQQARNEKIDHHELSYPKISFEELYLISKIVQSEAGSNWISDEQQRLVASVLINRVNSPEFPSTVSDVVYQPKQYTGVNSQRFANMQPTERAVRNALYILENGSILPASVVFQSNFKQGSGVYQSIYDDTLGAWTYFCYSNRPNLYS